VFSAGEHDPNLTEEHLMTETATFTKDTAIVRNGVDTAAMFATLDAIKAQPEVAKFQSGRTTAGWVERTTSRRSRTSTPPAERTPRARRPSSSTPASLPSCWELTPVRTRPNSSCTPSPPASPPRWCTRTQPVAYG
jgi:hypothetical protein